MARILIVEDDAQTANFIAGHLKVAGHKYAVVTNSDKAVQAARKGAADLIVLDVMMPGTSGFEVCRRIRSDAELYTIPILILSAMSGEEEVMHGLAQGADDYVTKPFEVQNLMQRIEALLQANSDVDVLDGATSLPSANAIKREVQKRVSRHEVFSLVSAELVRLREFAYKCGDVARQKAIRHMARTLTKCGKEGDPVNFMVGHMGGGYFVAIINPDWTDEYCRRVRAMCDRHLDTIYKSAGLGQAYQAALKEKDPQRSLPLLEVLVCATTSNRKDTLSSQGLFEVLMKIRSTALATCRHGIHMDRRA